MADGAVGGEARSDVIGVGGSREICLMAAVAGGGQSRVVVIHMALRARDGNVGAGEREGRGAVIEGRGGPSCGVMASCACGGEAYSDVIGACGSGVIGLVAAVAIAWNRRVVVVHVAQRAGNSGMSSGKWEHCIVVEGRGSPARGSVAEAAIRGEAGGDVVGIRGPGEIGMVTGVAGGWR